MDNATLERLFVRTLSHLEDPGSSVDLDMLRRLRSFNPVHYDFLSHQQDQQQQQKVQQHALSQQVLNMNRIAQLRQNSNEHRATR
jgi:hypothetical protein